MQLDCKINAKTQRMRNVRIARTYPCVILSLKIWRNFLVLHSNVQIINLFSDRILKQNTRLRKCQEEEEVAGDLFHLCGK